MHVCLRVCLFALLILGSIEPVSSAPVGEQPEYDIVVYGDSSAAVVAAVAARREGRSVILVNPAGFPGGMSASGLGATDFGKRATVGGIASEFYNAIAAAYGKDYVRSFEPHVGKQVFEKMIADAGVTVVYNEKLDRTPGKGVKMDGKRIQSFTTLNGKTYHGKMFVDATYVGDLMAAAGVSYTVGREPESQYGENLAGARRGDTKPRVHYRQGDKDHFIKAVDPYVKPGDPNSGLLPYIYKIDNLANGQGDKKIQSYNYRVCLTIDPQLRIPIEKPAGYREIDHELLLRNFDAGDERMPALIEPLAGSGAKVDWNNMHAVGSDYPGANWDYPEASYEKRREIEKEHEIYIRGFLWTLANNPRVPESIRKKVSAYGLPKDEFTDNGGWPWMIYIREARRMVSDYVMTQHECECKRAAPDPVGLGSFGMDSHVVQHFVTENGHAQSDGVIWHVPPKPYGISYRSIIPPRGECENLLVPVCLSASHVAHGSIRMEPVFMALGQSAAIAAGVAIDGKMALYDVSYPELRKKLEAGKQVVQFGRTLNPDVIGTEKKGGAAVTMKGGDDYCIGNNAISATFTFKDGSLRMLEIKDLGNGRVLNCQSGTVFSITMSDGRVINAADLKVSAEPKFELLVGDSKSARLAGRLPGACLTAALSDAKSNLRVKWRAVMTDGANYLRMEMDVTSTADECVLKEVAWMDLAVPGAQVAGRTDGSPVVAGDFFFGCEDPHAQVSVDPRILFRLPRNASLRKGEVLPLSFVAGVAPQGQMRRAFLGYLERERAHPYRPYLHYNSWHDLHGSALNETNCLDVIRIFGERFIKPHGVVLDGLVFDDGWDDPKTLWQFNSNFPNGFTPHAEMCAKYSTRLGVWLSPFGGYGDPKDQRLQFGREQGYEINTAGFSMAGPKYYAAFKQSCVGMIRKFSANHFKFDGIAAGMMASGGAKYVADTEAMRRLMLELRSADQNLYINLTTGSWPSPFWLRYADSIWRQGEDMGHAGKGSKQQKWLTYRDQEVYRNIVGKGPLFPLNSLMTQGVAYSRKGMAGDPTFNSAGFKDDVRAFFGSGTGLQELYIQPGKLTDGDWAVLAEAAKWSRANTDVLVDTHWIGGDPSKLEVYGYASWSPRKGIIMLRNPDDQPHEYALDVGTAFELPAGAPQSYRLSSPWKEDAAKPALTAESWKPLRLTLKPFEVFVVDAVP